MPLKKSPGERKSKQTLTVEEEIEYMKALNPDSFMGEFF